MVQIIRRSQWGARYAVTSGSVSRGSRRYLVWHYPGGNVSSDGAAVCRSIEQQHKNQGWSAAPGYNLLISRGGLIYEGCGLDMRGIHSPPHNLDGIGVQMMLNVGEAVPAACANAGRALAHWINGQMGRTLTPWWHGRDYGTSCPGNPVINWVKAGYPASGQPPTPAPPGQPPPGQGKAPPMPGDSQPWFGKDARSRSTGVRTWQTQMRARGWSIGVDGIFGNESDRVARQFQAEKRLAVDGKVGAQTWAAAWNAPVT